MASPSTPAFPLPIHGPTNAVHLGDPKPTANEPQQTEALWAHGLGMLHALSEKVFLARHGLISEDDSPASATERTMAKAPTLGPSDCPLTGKTGATEIHHDL